MLSKKIAIDLGTSTVRVFIKGDGIVATEPSVVALKRDSTRFVAFGNEVAEIVRRAPESVRVIRPLSEGVIADLAATEAMLRHFIDRAQGRQRIFKPEVMICVPTAITPTVRPLTRSCARREVQSPPTTPSTRDSELPLADTVAFARGPASLRNCSTWS